MAFNRFGFGVAGILALGMAATGASAQVTYGEGKFNQPDKFRQLEEILPTPNGFRTASGAPGPQYWQQRADYEIDAELDDVNQRLIGSASITYYNNSPDSLKYLWVQLDQNLFHRDSAGARAAAAPPFTGQDRWGRPAPGAANDNPDEGRMSFSQFRRLLYMAEFEGGFNITRVEQPGGIALPHVVVGTMMRIDLPRDLAPGDTFAFEIDWDFNIGDADVALPRQGFEYFEDDGNYLYEMAHWFPRMAPYTDVNGWQHKQFLGRGEFTLEFGDYLVRLTVPDDHIVASTGVLQNPEEVMTSEQIERFEQAASAETPMFIVTPEEAEANESNEPEGTKTWIFQADNVRDFAFASSRKFIWDAQGHYVDGNRVMAMSFYPKEGEPLWSRYSTHAIIHTLDVYSRYAFTYPYPVAISVNGPVGGMEYPMICFNGPRPEEDGTYTQRTKYGLIGVIIHEVGHFYFPMIVNSDERQWTWMDEGLNTFLQYLTEQEWEDEYPSRRGEPKNITNYMKSTRQVPIMTNSESLLQFGNNAYAKPATALNVLRETILGRELFDFAFREYSQRWKFKRPQPADFFRTMEDASGVDLDWFWRGWFYSTDHVDIAVTGVSEFQLLTGDPDHDNSLRRTERDAEPQTIGEIRNEPLHKRTDDFPELLDFYNDFDELDVTEKDVADYEKFLESLDPWEKELLATEGRFFVVEFENIGGLVMPIILDIEYDDGSTEEVRLPAEIWRYNSEKVSKLFLTDREIKSIVVDPHLETADVDTDNNYWPSRPSTTRFKLFKRKDRLNPMQIENGDWKKGKGDDEADAETPDQAADARGASKKAAEKDAE